jgi:hypothetical protein
MQEPFLINPPARKRAHSPKKGKHFHWSASRALKRIGREGTKHRPVVYTKGGHWQTSYASKIAAPGKRLNPFGADLLLMGTNPRKGRHMKRHRRRRNPARRHRRNPVANLTHIVPALISGGVSIFAVNKGSQMLGLIPGSILDYGAKLAIVVGGGWAADKWVSKMASDGWVIAGGATVAWQAISRLVGIVAPQIAGYGQDSPDLLAAYPDYAAFPDYSGYGYSMDSVGEYGV